MAKQTKNQKKETELIKFGDAKFVETFNQYEAKQRQLVKDNPFIEVVDNETWEIGKQRRTALRTGRTTLEGESKDVARKINGFKDWVKGKYFGFVGISVDAENKQQESVKKFEAIKEAEKQKEAEIEQQRTDGIRALIDECDASLTGIISRMTFDTILESEQTFDATVDSGHYDDECLMEFKFLFDEMVERQRDQLGSQIEFITDQEHKRLEDLKIKQQSMIDGLYRQANEQIDILTFENARVIKKEVNRILEIDFDFGDFRDKFESMANGVFTKLDRRIETLTKENEQLELKKKELELTNQRNRIVDIREGLLDLVFQITVDNYKEQNELIGKKIQSMSGLDPKLKSEWESMVEKIGQQLSQKMQFIDGQINQHAFKVEQREKELIENGFEKNDETGALTLDDDPDWTVFDDALWNMSDIEFDCFQADVNEMKEQNEINNRRWDSRKPELEKLGLVEIENEDGGEFIFEADPQIGIHSGMVIGLDDEDFAERFENIKTEIEHWKSNDAHETARQKILLGDKKKLTGFIKENSFTLKTTGIKNDEMAELAVAIRKEFDQWMETKIEQIKNF